MKRVTFDKTTWARNSVDFKQIKLCKPFCTLCTVLFLVFGSALLNVREWFRLLHSLVSGTCVQSGARACDIIGQVPPVCHRARPALCGYLLPRAQLPVVTTHSRDVTALIRPLCEWSCFLVFSKHFLCFDCFSHNLVENELRICLLTSFQFA